jgi:outer membrane protein OmpA-like peptidoglycan-associated protein
MNKILYGNEEHWIPMADLMSGMMLIFVVLAIVNSYNCHKMIKKLKTHKADLIKTTISSSTAQDKVKLYNVLDHEFAPNFKAWDAQLDKENMSIRFNNSEVLFAPGSPELNSKFQKILHQFAPRYIEVVRNSESSTTIAEIRIEGYTSNFWGNADSDTAYLKNMELSQQRAYNVLKYIYQLPEVSKERRFLNEKIVAIGYSSSHLILDTQGKEDPLASQRVEFKVLLRPSSVK